MLKTITKLLGGDPIAREIERYSEIVSQINRYEPEMQALNDDVLRSKTDEFRARLQDDETLDELLPEAFAVVRETAVRAIGMRHFDVQLIGGIVLHEGKIAEMKTGEGKTLVATMPIYLNALSGKGVHLVTVNDYLARRDARWMGPIFDFHGLSVGILQEASRTESGRKAFRYNPSRESTQEDVHMMDIVDRAEAYAADITYGTNNEFGFDYLRDNMARRLDGRVQRGHHYAILDEVDNILIDEARTPLIISGPAQDDPGLYEQMARVVRQLEPEDYEISERDRTVALTAIGEDHIEQLLGTPLRDPDRPEDITPEQARLLGHIDQALRAEHHFKRNKQYVVQGGRVIIVDEFTGRMMPGRRWSDGLHQAVEAKEGVKIRQENVTYATITLQNYFRMYEKLSGMTGTAVTEAEEFNKIYEVDVTPLPTNLEFIAMQPDSDLDEVEYREDGNRFQYYMRAGDEAEEPIFWRRKDYPDVVYRTEEAKFRAVATEILSRHVRGQPLLVGTTSVELSEQLSNRLRADMLKKLSMVHILRDVYLQTNELADDGMRIPELDPLYESLDEMKPSVLRNFARNLDTANNPIRPENLARLAVVLDLPPEETDRLAEVLDAGVPHNVLNAKKHDEESRIIADAGALGAVTIATNMAGRGVDIKLGGEIAEEVLGAVNRVLRRVDELDDPENMNMEQRLVALNNAGEEAIGIYESEIELFRTFMQAGVKVKDVGGLHVLGSERHDSRRIDNQLRGRAARQGDPGSSQFFLSLEDELMRLFGGSQVSGLMQRLNIDDAIPIAHGIVDRTIEQAQTRVEGANFDTRKHLLEYDDVLNQQREIFYGQRNRVFSKDDLLEDVHAMLAIEVEAHVQGADMDPEGPWKLLAWLEEIQPTLALEADHPYPSFMLRVLAKPLLEVANRAELKGKLLDIAAEAMESQHQHLARAIEDQFEAALTRLDDQVNQRVEMAEMAIEGAMLESQETGQAVSGRQLLDMVESAAGMRIQIEQAGEEQIARDPDSLRKRIPDLVDASLGLRVWAGMVQTIENRIGESLELERELQLPIDWDGAGDRMQTALAEVWQSRSERALSDIERELDQTVSKAEPGNQADVIRALVQMSYGQMVVFDKKTHQRRSAVVARLAYPFVAVSQLESVEGESLLDRVMSHLEQAWDALYLLLGQSELTRKAGAAIGDLQDQHQVALRKIFGQERFQALRESGPVAGLERDLQERIQRSIGQTILSEGYRQLILSVGDQLWVEYLTQMEALRTSIGLEAYGQRDPLVQYKSRAFDMFQNLLASIRAGVVSRMFRVQPPGQGSAAIAPTAQAAQAGAGASSQKSSGRRRRKRRRRN